MVQSHQVYRPPLRPVLEAHVTVTAATYTAKAGDRLIGVNRAGAVTVTLSTAQVRLGRVYTVKDESGAAATNNITVATEGSETIDGSATDVISDNYGSKTYYSDGTNWFTVPLLAVGSHTLASHSAKAHSDLTGVTSDLHHAQTHHTAHVNAGADALKLDDLATPDDNTDLNFSTTLHGLVPKGTNTGNFLKDDGNWAAPAGGGQVKQFVSTESNGVSTTTSNIPNDDTIPQNTEGKELFTLAITPNAGTNKIYIEVIVVCATNETGKTVTVALFKDTDANAIAAVQTYDGDINGIMTITLKHVANAVDTLARTYKVRAASYSGTTTFNGVAAGRKMGGVMVSGIWITEITP